MNSSRDVKQNSSKKAALEKSPKRVSRKAVKRRIMVKRIAGLVFALAVVAASFYASATLLFVVKTVNISGSGLFTYDEIADFMAIPMEESIFKVDTEQLENNLLEEFTYLEHVNIEKRFPDIIEVTLTDSTESFFSAEDDEYKIYSQNFKYLRDGSEPPLNAVWLDMDMENGALMDQTKNLLQLFEKYQFDGVTKISLVEENMIKVEYDNRLEINFGTILDIDYKIKMCKKIIGEKIPQGERGTIDATNSGEVVYTRQ